MERVQTGVRMEKRILKVLKAIAELKDMTLGDLLEGIVLHAFEGKLVPFSAQTLKEIEQLKALYGLTLKASDSHNLKERENEGRDGSPCGGAGWRCRGWRRRRRARLACGRAPVLTWWCMPRTR